MEWVETVGRSVPEALEVALNELGVDERDAEVVVVDEPRSGLFGIGRTEARIRVRVRPAAPRPKRPQRGRRSTSGRGESGERRQGARNRPAAPRPTTEQEPRAVVEKQDREQRESSRRAKRPEESRPAPRVNPTPGGGPNEEEMMSVEEQAEAVTSFVQGVVDRFGVTATTTARIEDNYIVVEVEGEDLGLLIGQRGATIDALQELARTVIQHRTEEQTARVILDIAGFRAKRAAALAEFVRRVAQEVLSTGVAQALEPMGAPDRKIVHDTVNEIEGVATTSEGVDPRRYVVIRATADAQ